MDFERFLSVCGSFNGETVTDYKSATSDFRKLFDTVQAQLPAYNQVLDQIRASKESQKLATWTVPGMPLCRA